MENQKKVPLIIGLSIPVLMILFVTGSIYLPRWFTKAHPQFNFLYSTGGYWNQENFTIREGKLQKRDVKPETHHFAYSSQNEPRLFIHDVAKNESTEISTQAAQAWRLNANPISPDGFEIVHGSYGDSIFPLFIGGHDYNTVYIKGHYISQKLNTQVAKRYTSNFDFIGWVER